MKTTALRFFGLFFLMTVMTVGVHAKCSCPKPPPPNFTECCKTYVQPAQIDIIENGIFILVNENMLQTSSILSDEQGLYFKDVKKQGNCPDFKWECNVCHACNDNWNNYCQICWN